MVCLLQWSGGGGVELSVAGTTYTSLHKRNCAIVVTGKKPP